VGHALRLGGVETSLIGLLQSFDYSRYEVDLFLYLHDGEFMPHIPKEVNVLPQNTSYASLLLPFNQNTFRLKTAKVLAKIYAFSFCKIKNIAGENFVYLLNLHRIAHWFLPKVNTKKYNLGISFLSPHYTLSKKLTAIKKVAWIHTDYSMYALDEKHELVMWKSFDKIAAIGNHSLKVFAQKFPSLKDKCMVVENILPQDFVKRRSKEFTVAFEKKHINLCSIGRFSYPKNFDNIPEITRNLLNHGVSVKWYIIGYGSDEALINAKIKEYNVEESVILLGKKSNPYPYIKACDVYVQPSRYEGKAVTVREAQMLHKPVVITNFPSAKSQLADGFDGIILPMETNAFSIALKDFLKDITLQEKLIHNCKNSDFSNQLEINKIYNLS
jgi:glycosyltransferase involved in cell wall biosynthesis